MEHFAKNLIKHYVQCLVQRLIRWAYTEQEQGYRDEQGFVEEVCVEQPEPEFMLDAPSFVARADALIEEARILGLPALLVWYTDEQGLCSNISAPDKHTPAAIHDAAWCVISARNRNPMH